VSEQAATSKDDSGEDFFSAGDYFLGLAQKAIATGKNTKITLAGKGEVTIYPARREFVADIADQAEFFQAPAAQFQTAEQGDTAPPAKLSRARHISELLWLASFHASRGRLMEGISKYDVVKLRQWPNLPQLTKSPNTERICALLTRHPTTIMLVHRQLGITKNEVSQVYSAAYSAGIVTVLNRNPQAASASEEEEDKDASQDRGLFRSLFAKISGL
jgi:hypothetical protein